MTHHIRKYFWVFNLLIIFVCALFAAKAVGHLVEANLPTPKSSARLARSTPLGGSAMTKRDVTKILERNIFCSSCEKVEELPDQNAGNGEQGPADGAPVKTSLNVKLIATLVSEDDKAWSFAAIEDLTENETRMCSIGSNVAAGAVVTDIMERRVLLQNNGRNEYLDLGAEAERGRNIENSTTPSISSRFKTPTPTQRWADVARGIRKVGDTTWEIQRSALNKVLGNTTMLARSARIVPSVRNGKPNGFKLYAIRPGSLYSLLGMFNGDTINAINGHAITTPDKALAVYTKLRNASHVSISFTRRGTQLTHEYNIR